MKWYERDNDHLYSASLFLPVDTTNMLHELGAYHCLGFDTFGPFKLVGGIAKGHPTEEEIAGATKFYREL